MLSATTRSFARISRKATYIDMPFSFKDKEAIEKILAKYPSDQKRSATLPLLHLGQKENGGYLSLGVIKAVADIVKAPVGIIQSTATFYSMFRSTPPGKHLVEVCRGLSCHINGGDEIKKVIEKECDCAFGKTSDDKMFTLEEVECLGACANSPCMIVDEVYYQDLTKKTAAEIISKIRKGESTDQYKAVNNPAPKPL